MNGIPPRCRNLIFWLARYQRIHTQRGHHIPRAHLTTIFIATKPIRSILVLRPQDAVRPITGSAWIISGVVEVGNVVRRFVAVCVLAYEARDVRLLASCGERAGIEQPVEEVFEDIMSGFNKVDLLFAGQIVPIFTCTTIIGQYFYPSLNIVNGRKAVLKSVGFSEVVVDLTGIVQTVKISIRTWPHIAALWIDQRTVGGGALVVFYIGAPVFKALGGPCDTGIVVRIFQGFTDRFTFVLNAKKTIFLVCV